MSLGLDALNRLQQMRAETAAVRAGAPLPSSARTKPPANRLLVGGLIFALGVTSAALYFRQDHNPAARPLASTERGVDQPAASATSQPPASVSTAAAPLANPPATPAQAQAPMFSIGTNAATTVTRVPAPSPNSLITSYLASGTVGGVDDEPGTGRRPFILFNDTIYHVDDVINPVLGIRLVGITPKNLTFQDTRGVLYVKTVFPM